MQNFMPWIIFFAQWVLGVAYLIAILYIAMWGRQLMTPPPETVNYEEESAWRR